ncbi:MAG: hypothetical protein ACYC6N_04985 [Pirellulaceae bacterium]
MESNTHYPTDSSLLWDAWRVVTRLLERARDKCRESVPHRFHTRKVKKLWLNITLHHEHVEGAASGWIGSWHWLGISATRTSRRANWWYPDRR